MNDPNQEATRAISERAFCGAIIRGDARATDAGLKADWFTVPVARRIFSAALAIETGAPLRPRDARRDS